MANRLYIVPVANQVPGNVLDNSRRPKYFMSDASGNGHVGIIAPGSVWDAKDYGFEPWIFVGADLSTSDDALVVGEADAFALPFDLSPTLTSQQVTSVQAKLESINVPAGWVTTALTWTQVARTVLWFFLLIQRYAGVHGTARLFGAGVTLSTTVSQLPSDVRADLTAAATSLTLDTSGIQGSDTLRAALKTLVDQLTQRPVIFSPTFTV